MRTYYKVLTERKICISLLPFFIFWITFSTCLGDYVIVDPIDEGEKVKAEINVILFKDHIQYLQKQQLW